MTPERWRQITEVFHRARRRDGPSRAAFLDEACASDAELRAEVDALLAADRDAGGFGEGPWLADQDSPTLASGSRRGPHAPPGDRGAARGGESGPASDVAPGLPFELARGTERFAIEASLGEGAFGAVYRARDRETRALVALKVLKFPHPEILYRFKREFRTLSRLTHPNVLRLYELFQEEGNWFLSMEYLDGVDVRTWVEETQRYDGAAGGVLKPRTPEAAFHVQSAEQVASPLEPGRRIHPNPTRLRTALAQLVTGVRALHDAGYLHRDLKPSNVLVTNGGRLVVLDFGLVSDGNRLDSKTTTGIAGTPVYMSPEQARGGPTSEKSDWYSVGAMLFELLTGRFPFEGDSMAVLAAKQKERPPDPREHEPGAPADLAELCFQLLSTDPTERPGGDEIVARLGAGAPHLDSPDVRTAFARTFVGREPELETLERAFALTREGCLAIAWVHGLSGIGKTALVEQFLSRLRRRGDGVVMLTGKCYAEEQVPFKAMDGVVDALSRFLANDAEGALFLPRDLTAVTRIFPVLRRARVVAEARRRVAEPADVQELRRRAFEGLRELFARIASQRPLVLFVDDLQWGDADSLGLLRVLVRRPDPPPLLLVGSYRSDEAASSSLLRALLDPSGPVRRQVGDDAWHEVRLEALDEQAAHRLATLQLGSESSRAGVVARESGGVPFFIAQMAAAYGDSAGSSAGEPTLDGALRSRLARLPELERRLLTVVALAGRPLAWSTAVRALDCHEESWSAVSTLQRSALLRFRASDERYDLEVYHDRIRECAVDTLGREDLVALHRAIAEALEVQSDADAEQLLFHLEAAGEPLRAASYAREAARRAAEKLAFLRAAELYRAALDLGRHDAEERGALLSSLGDALVNAGRGPEAATAYVDAAHGADPSRALDLRRRAAEQLLISGHFVEGKTMLTDVLAECGLKLAPSRRRALASLLLHRAYLRVRGLGFRPRPEQQASLLDLTRVDASWSASHALTVIDYIHGSDFGARHLLLALRVGEPRRVARAVALEVAHVGNPGVGTARRTARVRQLAERLVAGAEDPYLPGLMRLANGIAAFCQGQRPLGRELCDEAVAMFREHAPWAWWETTTAQFVASWARFWIGDFAELAFRVPRLVEDARQRGDLYSSTTLASSVTNVAWLVEDDVDGARRELRRAREQWRVDGFQFQDFTLLEADVLLALYAGNGEAAWRQMEKSWKDLEGSMMLRVQYIRVEMWYLRASAALAVCRTGIEDEEHASCRALVRKCVRVLARDRAFPGAAGLATTLRAALAAGSGATPEAISLLSSAEQAFARASMRMHAAAARRRRGALTGGDPGRLLLEEATAAMREERVRRPERVTSMLAAGFPEPS